MDRMSTVPAIGHMKYIEMEDEQPAEVYLDDH
jgi:hypothetical protein